MTGELQRDSNKLRLLTTLRDAASLKELQSQIIEIPATKVVALEDTLLERVSAMLQLHLAPGILHHLPVDETVEPGAYEFYEQGKGYLLQFNQQDVDRAISLFQKAIEKDSNFALAYANLAYAYAIKYRATNDFKWLDKARPLCTQAISLNDKLAPAHLSLGMIRQATGDLDGAIREFKQALELDPTDDHTRNLLSLAYDKAGRLLEAEALLKDAVKRNSASWVNYNFLGYFYYRHAQYDLAEPQFLAATELAPDNPRAFYNLGGVYLALGKYKDAEDILIKGIAIQPTYAAYSNLGLARQYQGRFAEAAAMFQKATELRPDDDRLWCNLGTAFTLSGNPAKAREAYEKALQLARKSAALRPKDGALLGALALYYAKLGEKTKAQETLAQAQHSSENDPELLFNSVLIYELIGERDHALAALASTVRAGYSLSEVQRAPELAQLRTDKRFNRIVGPPGS